MLTQTLEYEDLARAERMMEQAPYVLIRVLRRANMESSKALVAQIKDQKLRGQVLHRISGTLIRSWAAKVPPEREENAWLGGAGTNLNYAAAHEFGVNSVKSVQVRAHSRIQASRNTYRKSAANYRKGGTGVVLASEGFAIVHSFTRQQHTVLPARPYARPSLEEIREKVKTIHHDELMAGDARIAFGATR